MEFDNRLNLLQQSQDELWLLGLQRLLRNGEFLTWVSSFHPDDVACHLADSTAHRGGYNIGCKIAFDDGGVWFVRFPRVGKIHMSCVDEKTAMEVAAMELIRRETTIPVPDIKAWGLATQNTLGIGPFIMMEYVADALTLDEVLPEANDTRRLVGPDVTDGELEIIYRQLAGFQIQLWNLNFEQIGNLTEHAQDSLFPARPFTLKKQDLLQAGGVDTFNESFVVASERSH